MRLRTPLHCARQPSSCRPAPPAPTARSDAAPAPAASLPTARRHRGRRSASWANGAVFYEVFVRSFQDSDGDGKGDLQRAHRAARLPERRRPGDRPPTSGVDALWLMPVFDSPSYHGYDTTDYETINPDYGTNDDFDRLLDEAHRRGIKVIVDLVLNHTGVEPPVVPRVGLLARLAAARLVRLERDEPGLDPALERGQPHLARARAAPTTTASSGAGCRTSTSGTPRCRAEVKRLAALWLDRGVDGFRLDATRHLVEDGPGDGQSDTPETHAVPEGVRGLRPAR